jgi:hypothetical protein
MFVAQYVVFCCVRCVVIVLVVVLLVVVHLALLLVVSAVRQRNWKIYFSVVCRIHRDKWYLRPPHLQLDRKILCSLIDFLRFVHRCKNSSIGSIIHTMKISGIIVAFTTFAGTIQNVAAGRKLKAKGNEQESNPKVRSTHFYWLRKRTFISI